jgi:hypothetical protein
VRFHITKGLQKFCKETNVTLQVPQCSFISGGSLDRSQTRARKGINNHSGGFRRIVPLTTFISLMALRKARIPVRTPLMPIGISPSAFSTDTVALMEMPVGSWGSTLFFGSRGLQSVKNASKCRVHICLAGDGNWATGKTAGWGRHNQQRGEDTGSLSSCTAASIICGTLCLGRCLRR